MLVDALGFVIYVEHREFGSLVLAVVDSSGAIVCKEENPRAFLICRWKAVEYTERTVTVNNNGSRATYVLLTKNQ